MMRKLMVLAVAAPFLVACSADEAMEKSSLNVTEGLNQTYDIQSEDLVGKWNLVSMTSDVEVDLDRDGDKSTEILTETGCFGDMYFTFGLDGSVVTQQAKLNFDTAEGEMQCEQGIYSDATYEVNGNELKVGFKFDGATAYQTRSIDVYTVGEDDFLQLDLTYAEAKQYIRDTTFVSPTGATNVKAVEMLYQREK